MGGRRRAQQQRFFVRQVVGECFLRRQDAPHRGRHFALGDCCGHGFRSACEGGRPPDRLLVLHHPHPPGFVPWWKNLPNSPRPAPSRARTGTATTTSRCPSLSRSASRFSTAFVARVVFEPPTCDPRAAARLRAPDGWIASLEGSGPVSGT